MSDNSGKPTGVPAAVAFLALLVSNLGSAQQSPLEKPVKISADDLGAVYCLRDQVSFASVSSSSLLVTAKPVQLRKISHNHGSCTPRDEVTKGQLEIRRIGNDLALVVSDTNGVEWIKQEPLSVVTHESLPIFLKTRDLLAKRYAYVVYLRSEVGDLDQGTLNKFYVIEEFDTYDCKHHLPDINDIKSVRKLEPGETCGQVPPNPAMGTLGTKQTGVGGGPENR